MGILSVAVTIGSAGTSVMLERTFVLRTQARIVDPAQAPHRQLALVLGAATDQGRPTRLLLERCQTGAWLLQEGKVERLLLTGLPDEIVAMRTALHAHGISDEKLILDDGATRTLENLRRSRDLFDVRDALVVTNPFHLPRTLILAEALQMQLIGVRAQGPPAAESTLLKEHLSRFQAVADVVRLRFFHEDPPK